MFVASDDVVQLGDPVRAFGQFSDLPRLGAGDIAARSGHLQARFAGKPKPYVAYWLSRQPQADLGDWLALLFTLRDEIVKAEFTRVAHSRGGSTDGTPMPILTSTEPLVTRLGPV